MSKGKKFYKRFGFLKDIDMFQVPVSDSLNFMRHDSVTNESNFTGAMGSYIGGLLTLCIQGFIFIYMVTLILKMESGDIDSVKNIVLTNSLVSKDGKNNLALKDYKFLPIVEIMTSQSDESLK